MVPERPWGAYRTHPHVRRLSPQPDRLVGLQAPLGVFAGVVRKLLQLVLGCSQPSCPAVPSAQTDGRLLGPAGRHVRRLSPQPDRLVWLQAPLGVFSGVVRKLPPCPSDCRRPPTAVGRPPTRAECAPVCHGRPHQRGARKTHLVFKVPPATWKVP